MGDSVYAVLCGQRTECPSCAHVTKVANSRVGVDPVPTPTTQKRRHKNALSDRCHPVMTTIQEPDGSHMDEDPKGCGEAETSE